MVFDKLSFVVAFEFSELQFSWSFAGVMSAIAAVMALQVVRRINEGQRTAFGGPAEGDGAVR